TLSTRERSALRRIALKTWRYFDAFVGADDNWLPPDHYQEQPGPFLAHRTPAPLLPRRPRPRLREHGGARAAARAHARQRREPREVPGPPAELVRHAVQDPAAPPVRLHRGQRQLRGGAPRARRGPARPRARERHRGPYPLRDPGHGRAPRR